MPEFTEVAVVKEIAINDTTKLRVVVQLNGQRPTLDIRRWWLDEDADEWRPTQKGVNIGVKHLDTFLAAVAEGVDVTKEQVVEAEQPEVKKTTRTAAKATKKVGKKVSKAAKRAPRRR